MGRKRLTTREVSIMRHVGKRLRMLRDTLDKNQDEIANAVGVDRACVSQWERGKNLFSIARLPLVASAYGINDVSEFVRFIFSTDTVEEPLDVATGMVVRFTGFYKCGKCSDVKYLQSGTLAPSCPTCGETVYQRLILL